jgi:DNA topoisomerase II
MTFDYDDDALENLDLAFSKKRADERKDWISAHDGEFIDHTQPSLTYSDFINKELVQFAKYDTLRALPSLVDGFKPSQRKVRSGLIC